MKKLIRILAIISVVFATWLLPHEARAQSDPLLTQYWATPTLYNPGASGNIDYVRIRGAARLQWLGIENAPKSFMALADSPFKLGSKRIGVGVAMQQESLGLFSNMELGVQLSYKFKLLKGEFSIGVQPAYYTSAFKGSEVYIPEGDDYHQSTDTSIPNRDLSGNAFDLSAGIFYTHRLFWAGISGMHILSPKIRLSDEGSQSSETTEYETELPRTFYLTGGCNIPIKNTLFELQPSLMINTDLTTFNGQVTMRAVYNKFLSFGAAYRYRDAVSVMAGATFKNFFLGYAYDYPLSAIARASSGSHEIVIGYQLKLNFDGKNRNRHRSIRIM